MFSQALALFWFEVCCLLANGVPDGLDLQEVRSSAVLGEPSSEHPPHFYNRAIPARTTLPPAPSRRASGKTKIIAGRFGRDLWADSSFRSWAIRPAGQAAGRCPATRSSGAAQ